MHGSARSDGIHTPIGRYAPLGRALPSVVMVHSYGRLVALAVGASALLVGCKKGPYVSAHTSIAGETLAVGVMVVGPTAVTVGTQTKRFEREETFYLPLDDYPAGRHELPLLAKGPDGGKTETTVIFFAPHRTAGKAYFLVVGCGGDEGTSAELPASDRPVVRSEVGRTGACAGKGDLRVRAVTMPGATVMVVGTGKTSTADAAGEAVIPVSLHELRLSASTEVSAEKGVVLVNPFGFVKLRAVKGSQSLEATLRFAKNGPSMSLTAPKTVDAKKSFVEDWLKAFRPGQPLAPGLTGSATAKSAVYMERDGHAHYLGVPGPIRDIARVATLEDTQIRSCLGKVEYRTKVTVYDAKTGQKRVEKSFDAPKVPCATVVATLNGKVLTDHDYADPDTVDAFVLAN